MEYFITQIDIKKVRHLENLTIKLSDTERKHLILTGKNGSGKTSVLEYMRNYLDKFKTATIEYILGYLYNPEEIIHNMETEMQKYKALLDIDKNNHAHLTSFLNLSKSLENIKLMMADEIHSSIKIKVNLIEKLLEKYKNDDFLIVYFPTKRQQKPYIPKGAKKLDAFVANSTDNSNYTNFIQYLVNLNLKKLNAYYSKDYVIVNQIDDWFAKLEKILQNIFQDDNLYLDFDIDTSNYYIASKGREKFDFTTLSDGYSAFLNIVIELMLRMESKAPKVYDIQGIVLIDEIETHLHIDLQKKIMPMLTTFFPKIQFIVTTHSPFVLSSISNSVIYDLEKHLRVEDLSSYAVDGIIEGYFDADKYSQEIKNKFEKYKTLLQKESPSIEEREELVDLRSELKDISAKLAPELAYDFKTLEISRLSKING